jgi:hypothetical protein
MNWLTCAGKASHLLTPIQASQCYTALPAIRLSSITITGEMGRRPARNSDAPVAGTKAQTIRIAAGRAPLGYRRHGMRRPASQVLSVRSEAATLIREVLGSDLIRGSEAFRGFPWTLHPKGDRIRAWNRVQPAGYVRPVNGTFCTLFPRPSASYTATRVKTVSDCRHWCGRMLEALCYKPDGHGFDSR